MSFSNIKQPFKAKVTGVKITKTKKKGYKKAVVTVKFSSSWKPSSSTTKRVWQAANNESSVSYGGAFGSYYCVVVDSKTGVNLEKKNAYGVKVKTTV